MNLFFLVEGQRTEPKVYAAWLAHTFPQLRHVRAIDAVDENCVCIFSGYGYPQYRKRLESAFLEIGDHPVFDHFFLCIDSEEHDYETRVNEVRIVVDDLVTKTAIHQKNHHLELHIIVQHCCIETWFLGHRKMMRKTPMSPKLAEMKRFYDVRDQDPELMSKPDGYVTRASYHLEYLKEMLLEHDITYSKTHPGIVAERDYLDALRERWSATGHLGSLGVLFSKWNRLAETISR